MWRKPDYHTLDAPPEIKDLMHESIYYNSEGKLSGATSSEIIPYVINILILVAFTSALAAYVFSLLLTGIITTVITILIVAGFFCVAIYYFYIWGWRTYEEAWYHFDEDNEIFTVIRRPDGNWETIEMPYEQIHSIEWEGGNNGKAVIHAAEFSFSTNRALDKRHSSVTEIWDKLARIDTRMRGWPIEMYCPKCKREFGHHIGTATCPFDRLLLIDPSIKGRIDPENQHPDDLDRI